MNKNSSLLFSHIVLSYCQHTPANIDLDYTHIKTYGYISTTRCKHISLLGLNTYLSSPSATCNTEYYTCVARMNEHIHACIHMHNWLRTPCNYDIIFLKISRQRCSLLFCRASHTSTDDYRCYATLILCHFSFFDFCKVTNSNRQPIIPELFPWLISGITSVKQGDTTTRDGGI